MKLLTLTGLISLMICFSVSNLISQNPGELDTSFNGIGYVETDFQIPSKIFGVAVQEDQKIVVAGYSFFSVYNMAFARYNTDGSLDQSFGPNGTGYFSHVFSGSNDIISDLVLQPDGKILVSGYTASVGGTGQDAFVARLNEDGTFDNTFSSDGITLIDVGEFDVANSLCLQDDGKILISGTIYNTGASHNLLVSRLNSNGQIDSGFGNNGSVIIDVDYGSYDFGEGIAEHNGYIYLAGLSYSDVDRVVIVSLTNTGQMNNNFGSGGILGFIMDISSSILSNSTDLIITHDNKIAVSAFQNPGSSVDFAVFRALLNGYPDENFGTHGKVVTDMIGDNKPFAIVEQSDGNLLLGGYHEDNFYGADFTIARYLDNGELDATFGNHYGVTWENLSTNEQNPDDMIYSLALQADGKIIAAGYSMGSEHYNFAIARFYSGIEVGITNSFKDVFSIKYLRNNNVITIKNNSGYSPEYVALIDLQGREIISSGQCNSVDNSCTIKLTENIVSGFYIVKIVYKDKVFSKKILIN